MICELCGGYHATHTCMQAQNMDYYGEFGHYNSCFDQCNHNWGNYSAYGQDNQCANSDSLYFYDYQPERVQYESKLSLDLAIERLANISLPWQLESEPLTNDSKPSSELAIEIVAPHFF